MRSVGVLLLALAVGLGVPALASAQLLNETGTFSAKVGVVPGLAPGGSLPGGLPDLGPDLYVGNLVIHAKEDGSANVLFRGDRPSDGADLIVRASFGPGWAGIRLGNLVVGSSSESDVIVSINVDKLENATAIGVGTVDGEQKRVIATFGAGGELRQFRVVPAPRHLR